MPATTNLGSYWNDPVPSDIDQGVRDTMNAGRVATNVFKTVMLPSVTSVPADHFDPQSMSIAEGHMKPYIELVAEFPLTNGQVKDEPDAHTIKTLSKLAAKNLAIGEDMIILLGRDAQLPGHISVESGRDSLDHGLLGLVRHTVPVLRSRDAAIASGEEIMAAVNGGIALLSDKDEAQTAPFALITDPRAFVAIVSTIIGVQSTYQSLHHVLDGGIHKTPAMPPDTALLVALGGDPTVIYFDQQATLDQQGPVTEHTERQHRGQYFFRTFDRFQYVARDPRAFVRIDFSDFKRGDREREVALAAAGRRVAAEVDDLRDEVRELRDLVAKLAEVVGRQAAEKSASTSEAEKPVEAPEVK